MACRQTNKREARLNQLKEVNEKRFQWEGINRLKSTSTPKFCKLKDNNGKRIPEKEYAQSAADSRSTMEGK